MTVTGHKGGSARRLSAGRVAGLAVALGLMTVLPGSALGATPPASNWPTSGHDAAQSNLNPTETILTSVTLPSLKWQRGIGLPPIEACEFNASPVVVGNTLYTTLGVDVAAFDLTNGRQLWRSNVQSSDAQPNVALAVSGSRVVVATSANCASESDPAGTVYGFDAATGTKV